MLFASIIQKLLGSEAISNIGFWCTNPSQIGDKYSCGVRFNEKALADTLSQEELKKLVDELNQAIAPIKAKYIDKLTASAEADLISNRSAVVAYRERCC